MSVWKRNLVVVAIVLFVGAAVYLNWSYGREASAAGDAGAQQDIIDEANASIQAMAAVTMSEAQVENLVTAKGYGDCVCFINDNSASVVVSSTENGLSQNDVTKIMEIVKEKTGLTADKITVIETEP